MMYVGKPPWHELGTRLETPPATSDEAIRAARLDWNVLKVPLFASDGQHWYRVPERVALVPESEWGKPACPIFGTAQDSYAPLQNEVAFSFFDPLVKRGDATYETAGALGQGEKVWVLAKIKKSVRIAATDELEKYVLLTNGHDGNTAVQVLLTPVRVVCQNTLSLALHRAGSIPQIYHQTGMRRKLADAFVEIEKVVQAYDNLEATFNEMAKAQVSQDRLSEYLRAVFPDPTPPTKNKKTQERYEREVAEVKRNRSGSADLFESGKGNKTPRVSGTLWAAYNGVVEHLDHRCPYSSRSERFAKLIFGEVARVKTSALLVAQARATKWGNN